MMPAVTGKINKALATILAAGKNPWLTLHPLWDPRI
jgi:hypothetical protein